MTAPIDESPTSESAGTRRASYRVTWILTTTGIVGLLLFCMAIILVAAFR